MKTDEDAKAAFLQIPWAANLINRPGVICRTPGSRQIKHDTEDTLFAQIFKTPRTLQQYMCFYRRPSSENEHVEEVSTLANMGDGMNGHTDILHGGIVAGLIDESMGIFQSVNSDRARLNDVKLGTAEGKLPPQGDASFTAELTVRYLRPVSTPGCVLATSRRVKKEGRKEWMICELKQYVGSKEGETGELVTCATGEGFFIRPRNPRFGKL